MCEVDDREALHTQRHPFRHELIATIRAPVFQELPHGGQNGKIVFADSLPIDDSINPTHVLPPRHSCLACPNSGSVIVNGSEPVGGLTPKSRKAWLAASSPAAAAFGAANSSSSWADPTRPIEREPRREDHTICTVVAPEAVFTVRV